MLSLLSLSMLIVITVVAGQTVAEAANSLWMRGVCVCARAHHASVEYCFERVKFEMRMSKIPDFSCGEQMLPICLPARLCLNSCWLLLKLTF